MVIAFDGKPLTIPYPCGTRRYAEGILWGLSQVDKQNTYLIFVDKEISAKYPDNFHTIVVPRRLPVFNRQLFLHKEVSVYKPDIVHYLFPFGPLQLNHPRIVTTVHDVNLDLIIPKDCNPKYIYWYIYMTLTRRSVFKKTKAFICVTDAVKNELIQMIGDNDNLFTVHEGIRNAYFAGAGGSIRRGFVCFSDFSPRKNTQAIITGYMMLPEKVRNTHKLNIVLSASADGTSIVNMIPEGTINRFIYFHKNPTDGTIKKLYSSSAGLIYVSLYEGFGLPPLEAMAAGCPVVATNYGAVKEVVGDAGMLVDPKNISQISRAMQNLATDVRLQKQFIIRGKKRAEKFSWTASATETLKVYSYVYERF